MAKDFKPYKEAELSEEMTLEQAKAYRASLYVPAAKKLSDEDKREEFRIFWAKEKAKYGRTKELEGALWMHLKAIGKTDPAEFIQGIEHFGLKKL